MNALQRRKLQASLRNIGFILDDADYLYYIETPPISFHARLTRTDDPNNIAILATIMHVPIAFIRRMMESTPLNMPTLQDYMQAYIP